jgi:DNA segregation ATPase FtsK/SpoIIIE, S-DNA-T family
MKRKVKEQEETAIRMKQKTGKNKRNGGAKASSASHRQRTIAAVAISVIGVLLLLSIISYTPADEVVTDVSLFELWKVFGNDDVVQAKADRTQNWLGLIGAILSHFLINTAFGYTVIFVPFLIIIWGWYLLRGRDTRNLIMLTNYTLVIIVLASTMFGLVRLIGDEPVLTMTWSGLFGDYLASSVSKLLGIIGGTIVIFTLLAMTVVFAVDLDVQRTLDRLKHTYASVQDWLVRKIRDRRLASEQRKIERRQKREERNQARGQAADERDRTSVAKKPVVVRPASEESERGVDEAIATRSPVRTASDTEEYGKKGTGPKSVLPRKRPDEQDDLELEINEGAREEETDVDRETQAYLASDDTEDIDYVFPSVELLDSGSLSSAVAEEELKANAELLREKLADFGVEVESVSVTPGPVLTLYELVPAAGVKISKITSLSNDLALALQAKGIRILAPIPGKGAVGVEIPNHNPSLVTFRSVINSKRFHDSNFTLPMAMGKTISGEVYVDDLARLPHLLIAGSTGSGKSVGINTIIASFLYRLHPSDVKFVVIDPKKIELTPYRRLERHYLAVSPDINEKIATNAQNAVTVLRGVEIEMEKRYDTLASAGVRNISDYNKKIAATGIKSTDNITHKKLPYIIVIIDELADLMLTAAKDVEDPIARLAQLARAVGIHLIVATQRPSVDVITGVIKANFSARIAYQVASKTDSRTILDTNGAEQLLGNGDMLYLPSGSPKPIRLQNSFLSSEEVERLTGHIKKQPGYSKPYYLPSVVEKKKSGYGANGDMRDELFEEAAELVVRHQQGSVSLIQRRLKVGYSRAARIIDELEAAGIVGPFDGSKARQVLVETESELAIILESRNL